VRLPGKSRPGFTVVELVLVLAAVLTAASAALPAMDGLHKQWTLLGATRLLEQSLQWGRMHAVASNSDLAFEVDSGGKQFYWKDPRTGETYEASRRHLPGDVRVVSYPRRPLRFFPRGNAVPAGTFTLQGDAGTYRVIVSPAGRIRVEKN